MESATPALETLRDLTLQIMLISAGVFGIVGGFISSADKTFVGKWFLGTALILFSASALLGYLLHGVLISLVTANAFDPFNDSLVYLGIAQIAAFTLGGIFFTIFVMKNIN
jgi:hypothetical protein